MSKVNSTALMFNYTNQLVPMFLFGRYPSLRVAYIDEVEEPSKERPKKINKVYYSCLVKAMPKSSSPSETEPVQYLDQVC